MTESRTSARAIGGLAAHSETFRTASGSVRLRRTGAGPWEGGTGLLGGMALAEGLCNFMAGSPWPTSAGVCGSGVEE